MGTGSVMRRGALALVCAVQLLATTTPSAAADLPPLSEWPVGISSGPVALRDNDGRGWQEPGHWSARGIRRGSDGHLRFTLRVTPAPVHLPVRSGPAVLFVGVGFSGGGSVGYEEVVRVTRETAPACRRDPCTYRFKVDADLSALPAAAAAAPLVGPEAQAEIGVTLVRTFGDGTWMQVLDTFDGRRALSPGRTSSGRIASMGLVPVRAVEGWSRQQYGSTIDLARRIARATRDLPDPSRALPTVRVRLAVDAPGCWPYLRLAIHDDQGARPLDADLLELDPASTVVDVPDGLPWTVSLWEGGIFDGNDTGGVSAQAGSFTTAGENLEVTAHYVCDGAGTYTGSLTVAPASDPLPRPTTLSRLESTSTLEGPRQGRKRLPFTVTSTPRAFLALGWAPDDGWTEWSSRSGTRWRSRLVPITDGLPSPPDLLDARLWSVDQAPRLTTITEMPDGSRQVRIWQRTSQGRWSNESGIDAGVVAGSVPASVDAGYVGAFVGHGGDALLLLSPDAKTSTGQVRLLRWDGGEWRAAAPTDGMVTSVAATADGFAIAVRTTGGGDPTDTLLTSADGATWAVAGSLPTGTSGPPQLAVADGTLLAFSSDATGMTHGWRWEPDGSWSPALVTLGTLFPGGIAAHDGMVTVLTRIDGRAMFTAAAVSRDGGRTWARGEAVDESPKACRFSIAIRPPTAVVGAGGCRARSAATRLAPADGG